MKPISSWSYLALSLTVVVIAGCDSGKQESSAMPDESTVTAPVARIEAVQDELHGTIVEDPYRWLENWGDEEVKAFRRDANNLDIKLFKTELVADVSYYLVVREDRESDPQVRLLKDWILDNFARPKQ